MSKNHYDQMAISLEFTLEQIDALVKTVAIAKDNLARKMKDNLHQTQHRAYRTAADDFRLMNDIYSVVSNAQATSLLDLGEPF